MASQTYSISIDRTGYERIANLAKRFELTVDEAIDAAISDFIKTNKIDLLKERKRNALLGQRAVAEARLGEINDKIKQLGVGAQVGR